MPDKKIEALKRLSSILRDAYSICTEMRFMLTNEMTVNQDDHNIHTAPLPPALSESTSIAESREEILRWGKEAKAYLQKEAQASSFRRNSLEDELKQVADEIKNLSAKLLAIEMKYF